MSNRETGGKSTPPLGGLGPLRRSGRGGWGDGSDGKSAPPGGSGGKSEPPGGSEGKSEPPGGSDGKSTPPSGKGGESGSTQSGPSPQTSRGGRGSSSRGRESSSGERRPILTPSDSIFASLIDNAKVSKKLRKIVNRSSEHDSHIATPVTDHGGSNDSTPLETPGSDNTTGQYSDSPGSQSVEDSLGNKKRTVDKTIQLSSDSAAQVPDRDERSTLPVSLVNKSTCQANESSPSNTLGKEKNIEQPSDSAAQVPVQKERSTLSVSLVNKSTCQANESSPRNTLGKEKNIEQPSDSAAQVPVQKERSTLPLGEEKTTERSSDSAAQAPVLNERSTQPVSHVPGNAPTKRDRLKAQFQDFLENPGRMKLLEGDSFGYYEAQVKVMALCRWYKLDVKFKDLLRDKKFAELAMEIANDSNRDHEWLLEVAQDFMMRSFKDADRSKLRLSFSGVPESMRPLKSIPQKELVHKVNITHTEDKVPAPTPFGRHVYLSVMLHVLDRHDEGVSWKGLFELEDVYILVYQDKLDCWIAKETGLEDKDNISFLDRCSTEDKVLDIHKLDSVLTNRYIDGNTVPLYFDKLREDLRRVGPIFLDENPWFFTYLRFHVALMSSMARKFLINELFHLMCNYKLLSEYGQKFSAVFTYRQLWTEDLWRKNNPLLVAVYKHDNPFYEDESTGKTKASKRNTSKGKAGKRNTSKGKAGDSNNSEKVDRYDNKLGSALSYKRHLIWHTHHNIDDADLQEDFDGLELFAAWTLPVVLPTLIEHLLSENNMTGKFAKLWSSFCAMRSAKEA